VKVRATIVCAGLACLSLFGPACGSPSEQPNSFTPEGVTLAATGTMTLARGSTWIACAVTLNGDHRGQWEDQHHEFQACPG
jgi:hypothetical protein